MVPASIFLLHEAVELGERAGPAVFMPIAGCDIEELFVQHVELRVVARRVKSKGDQRFALRRAFPRPGENEFVRPPYFPVGAADVVFFTVERVEDDVETAADADIRLRNNDLSLIRSEPALEPLGLGPCSPDLFRRGWKERVRESAGFSVISLVMDLRSSLEGAS